MRGSQDGGMGEDGHEHHERVSIGDVRHGGGGGAGDGDGQEEGAVVCIEGSYSIFSGALAIASGTGVGCGGAVDEKQHDINSVRGGAHWDGVAGWLHVPHGLWRCMRCTVNVAVCWGGSLGQGIGYGKAVGCMR